MAVKYVPERQCVVCRERFAKKDLIRFVATSDGVVLDRSGRLNGRGAYVCRQPACHEKARRSGVLERQLKRPVPADVWQELAALGRD